MIELVNHLSHSDLTDLLCLSHQSLSCNNHRELKSLVLGLNKLFYFENAVCAQGNVQELVQSDPEPDINVFDISYPAGYLDLYFEKQYHYTDAVFCEFVTNLSPVYWNDVDKVCGESYPASVMALDFNMKDGWTHGTIDPHSTNCSVFFFGGPSAEKDIRTYKILEYIIPFYSVAYQRVLKRTAKVAHKLTKKEMEVLSWIKEGKTSWDISMILNCSKRVVEFHVENIKKKLNAINRAQAVAIGLQHGVISF